MFCTTGRTKRQETSTPPKSIRFEARFFFSDVSATFFDRRYAAIINRATLQVTAQSRDVFDPPTQFLITARCNSPTVNLQQNKKNHMATLSQRTPNALPSRAPTSFVSSASEITMPYSSHTSHNDFTALHRRRRSKPVPYTEYLDDNLPEAPPSLSHPIPSAKVGLGVGPNVETATAAAMESLAMPTTTAAGMTPFASPQPSVAASEPVVAVTMAVDHPSTNPLSDIATSNQSPNLIAAAATTVPTQSPSPHSSHSSRFPWPPATSQIPSEYHPFAAYCSAQARSRHSRKMAALTPGPAYPTRRVFRLYRKSKGFSGASWGLTFVDVLTGLPVLTCERQRESRLMGVVKDAITKVPALFISLCTVTTTHAYLLVSNVAEAPVFTAAVWMPVLAAQAGVAQTAASPTFQKGELETVVECVAGDLWRRLPRRSDGSNELEFEAEEKATSRLKRRWIRSKRMIRILSSHDGHMEWLLGPQGETLATLRGKPEKRSRRNRINGLSQMSEQGVTGSVTGNTRMTWSVEVAPGVDVGIVLAALFCQRCALQLVLDTSILANLT